MGFKIHDVQDPAKRKRIADALRESTGDLCHGEFGAGGIGQNERRQELCHVAQPSAGQKGRPARSSYNPKVVILYFREVGIRYPVFEFQFHPVRKWRFDMAWWPEMVALEVQGGTWRKGGGAHRGTGAERDYEKFTEAACLGWRILYCQPKELCTEATTGCIKRALAWKFEEIKP